MRTSKQRSGVSSGGAKRAPLRCALVGPRRALQSFERRLAEVFGPALELHRLSAPIEAVAALTRRSFDVVFVEQNLGHWSGLQLIRRLSGEACGSPMILLHAGSGSDAGLSEKALEAGAADCLSRRNVNPSVLERTVRFARETSRLESKLRREAQRAESASQAKSAFLARMSHDLRTPLNAILGFSQMLELHAKRPQERDRSAEYAGYIRRSGADLLALVNALLDLSRIEAGKQAIQPETVPLVETLREVALQVGPQATRKDVSIDLKAIPAKAALRADPMALRQMLTNLLSNAVKFSPAGSRVEIGAEMARKSAAVWVRDQGPGMDAAQQAIARTAFGQVGQPATRAQEGTGLGLAIVQALIELHGGRLDIESAPDLGAKVALVFPETALVRDRQRSLASEPLRQSA